MKMSLLNIENSITCDRRAENKIGLCHEFIKYLYLRGRNTSWLEKDKSQFVAINKYVKLDNVYK